MAKLRKFPLGGPGDPIYNGDQNKFTRLFGRDLYENFTPIGYGAGGLRGIAALLGIKAPNRDKTPPIREDAWALYLGLPQESNSFVPSEYTPSEFKNKDSVYFDSPLIRNSLIEKRANVDTKVNKKDNITTGVNLSLSDQKGESSVIEDFLKSGKDRMVVKGSKDNVLGDFTLSKGEDKKGKYISYYDKWDLKGAGPLGKPFEVYGRIYEDEVDNFKFPKGGPLNNNIMPAKLDRCVKEVSKQKGVKNAWAICNASISKKEEGGDVDFEDMSMVMPAPFVHPSMNLVPAGNTLMGSVRNQIAMRAFQNMALGGMTGGLPSIPAAFQLDTINNTPSNIPGGAGGRYDLSQIAIQQHNPLTMPKAQAFSDPIFGNKLLDPDNRYQPAAFKKGGKTFFGKIFKGIGEGLAGIGDLTLSAIGAGDVFQNTFVDRSKPLSAVANTLGSVGSYALDAVAPGVGTGARLLGSGLNNLGQQSQTQPQMGGTYSQPQFGNFNLQNLFSLINQPQPTSGMFNGQFSGSGLYGNAPIMSGTIPYGGMFGGFNPFVFSPGFVGKNGGFIPSRFRYQEGGPVMDSVMVPIQTEKVKGQPEMIIHRDGTITPVNATKRHKHMDDEEVTDIVEEGSYIASADPAMKLSWKDAEDIVIGVKAMPYQELKQGKPPEEITLASELWKGRSRKDKTFAELTEMVSRKFPTVDKSDYFEHGNDIFTQMTNKANIESRYPYLTQIVGLNEERRPDDGIAHFGRGGSVPKAQFGEAISQIMTYAPALLSLFGAGQGQNQTQGPGGISPAVQAGILGSIPLYQSGVNQNIAAQQGALGQGIQDYSALGNQLINFAGQSAAAQTQANAANTLLSLAYQQSRETNLPELNTDVQASRINNFRPQGATRASVDALSTPNFDAGAIMSQLGARSGPVIAQLYSDNLRNRNQLAAERNRYLDQIELNKIGQLNQLDTNRDLFNIGQQEKERALRESVNQGSFGSIAQGYQRGADLFSGYLGQVGGIQGQTLGALTQLQMQQAQLAGQPQIQGAQNAFNAFSTLGSIQSQNATALQMLGQKPGAAGTGAFDSIGNFGRYVDALYQGGRQPGTATQLPGRATTPLSRPAPSISSNLRNCPPGSYYDPNVGSCVQ